MSLSAEIDHHPAHVHHPGAAGLHVSLKRDTIKLSDYSKAFPLDVAQLDVDRGEDSIFVLDCILNASRHSVQVYEAIDISSEHIFEPKTAIDLKKHIQRLSHEIWINPYSDKSIEFLQLSGKLIQDAIFPRNALKESEFDSPLCFNLLLSPDENHTHNRFGVFEALFPRLHEVLTHSIPQTSINKLDIRALRTNRFKRTIEHYKAIPNEKAQSPRQITIAEIVTMALRKNQSLDEDPDPDISLSQIFQEAITIRQILSPVPIARKNNDLQFNKYIESDDDLALSFELSLLPTKGKNSETWEIAKEMRVRQRQSLERVNGKPSSEKVRALLQSTELLANPRDFDLATDSRLTELIREKVPNKYIGAGMTGEEKRRSLDRILVLLPEAIRANPEGFYEYQRVLVQKIALRLGIPIDKDVLAPFPPSLSSPREQATFREQEKILKNYREKKGGRDVSDWHWLLLYPEVQAVFFEMLPYCGVPPVAGYKASVSHEKRIAFPWDPPRDTKLALWAMTHDVVNQLRFLNHWDAEEGKNKLSVPAEFIHNLLINGYTPILTHGIARMMFFGTDNFSLDSRAYVAYKKLFNDILPEHDIDMLILSRGGDIASLAVAVAKKYPIIQSIVNIAKSMNPVLFIEATKKNETLFHGIEAWMGREVAQPTPLLALALLGVAKIRSFGLLPEIKKVATRRVVLTKPVDIFGGLIEYLKGVPIGKNMEKVIRFVSEDDAFPYDQPIAYWLLFRTFSDEVWMKRDVDWGQFDLVVTRLLALWPKTKYKLDDIHREDLHKEALRSLLKSFSEDRTRTWKLLSDCDNANPGKYELAGFFPSLHAISKHPNVWRKILTSLRQSTVLEHEDEIGFVARAICQNAEACAILAKLHNQKSVSISYVEKWIKTETIFIPVHK